MLIGPGAAIVEKGEIVFCLNGPGPLGAEYEEADGGDDEIRSALAARLGVQGEVYGVIYLERILRGHSRPFRGVELRCVLDHRGLFSELILKVQRENLREEQKKIKDFEFHEIVTEDPKFMNLLYNVRRFVRCRKLLIQGESGTGKELVSRMIHRNGIRRDKPFIAINCAAFTETLLNSELFGHKRGAFSGAVEDHTGLFERANHGTIFLDEIDKMSLPLQECMLRVIENGEVRRVGESRNRYVDVVLICASSKELREAVDSGHFHPELYYRICRPSILLPPLRERSGDVPILVSHFIEKINQELGKEIRGIIESAMNLLVRYPWPGNVRELIGVIEIAVLLTVVGEE